MRCDDIITIGLITASLLISNRYLILTVGLVKGFAGVTFHRAKFLQQWQYGAASSTKSSATCKWTGFFHLEMDVASIEL